MRNTIKTLVAFLIVLSATKTNASIDSTKAGTYCKVVAQEKQDQFKLIYKGYEVEPVLIQWLDEDDEIVYSESIKGKDAFVKQYNLSTLPEGNYRIVVTAEDYKYTEEVKLGDLSDLKFSFRKAENKTIVMTGFKGQDKEVILYVYDEDKNPIYTETTSKESVFQRKYNFSEANTSEVTFVLSYRGESFSEETFVF
ncbi:MAG: hypothetical protein JXR03_16840 [Cyclobacteriaceae bacterium]